MTTIRVECPECKGHMDVDSETGKVLSHVPYQREVKSLDQFLGEQKNRSCDLEERFRKGKQKEKTKLAELEKKFNAAKDNKDLKDPPPSVFWD